MSQEQIQTMLKHIQNNNIEAANVVAQTIIADKMNVAKDAKKMDVASKIYQKDNSDG
jgi:hypothetical protein